VLKRIGLALIGLMLGATIAQAQLQPDACNIGYSAIQVAKIAISTATTTEIVAAVAGKAVYVCGIQLQNGASSTAQFTYGTKASTACDTGSTALSGVLLASTNTTIAPGSRTVLSTPAGNELCIVSTGTGGSVGWVNFIQQ
jgi:hypothetical protein